MPTERIYYADSYLAGFEARVLAHSRRTDHPALALDRSAFYPEGGGQPADRGTINGLPVIDVQAEDELVWHVIAPDVDLPPVDSLVTGRIDMVRRYDHMQQHCGQHILTAAFIAACRLPTIAFHLSDSSVTIDLASESLSTEQVAQAEALANQVIWQNQQVYARFVDPVELKRIKLRKPPAVHEQIRVVSIGDFDHSACGGTHPQSSGGVGMVVIRGWSRQKGTVRIEFACGGRALRDYRRLHSAATRSAAILSVGVDELEVAIERLRSQHEAGRKALEQAAAELLAVRAEQLYAAARVAGSARIVCRSEQGRPEQLRALAQQIAALPGGVALLGTADDRAHLVVACAADSGHDARNLLQAGLPLVEGRGGGNARLAQGGGPRPEALAAALSAMDEAAGVR